MRERWRRGVGEIESGSDKVEMGKREGGLQFIEFEEIREEG